MILVICGDGAKCNRKNFSLKPSRGGTRPWYVAGMCLRRYVNASVAALLCPNSAAIFDEPSGYLALPLLFVRIAAQLQSKNVLSPPT